MSWLTRYLYSDFDIVGFNCWGLMKVAALFFYLVQTCPFLSPWCLSCLIVVTECYSKEPKDFRSCALRNCCSWGWGNRYVTRWKVYISCWHTYPCSERVEILFKIFISFIALVMLESTDYIHILFIDRSGTFAKGCKGYNY